MESIESIVSVSSFSKNLLTCCNPLKTGKHKLYNYKSMNPQKAHAFKHAARHVQEFLKYLIRDTFGRQSP